MSSTLTVSYHLVKSPSILSLEIFDITSKNSHWDTAVLAVVLLIGLGFIYRLYDRHDKLKRPLRFSATVLPGSYSIWSALFGTQSVVHAKIIAELFSNLDRKLPNKTPIR